MPSCWSCPPAEVGRPEDVLLLGLADWGWLRLGWPRLQGTGQDVQVS